MERLTESSFKDAIDVGQKKVVVKFYADWCPDCRRTKQGSEEIAREYVNEFSFYQVNVDEETKLADEYLVKGIPSFLVFQEGQEINRLYSRDAKTTEQIRDFIRGLAE